MRQIDALNWLRGLMALAILFFHSATIGGLGWAADASTVLGKLGIYGVSIFFILSGLTLAHVYHARLDTPGGVASFFVRRAFRIWPLLSFVVALQATIAWQAGTPYSLPHLAANATGLFGFIRPSAYINVGAWSIGNEMVYYALTPALVWAFTRSKVLGNALVAGTALIGVAFAFLLLDPAKSLTSQWATYVNPFNNLWLFAAGIAIFYNLRDREIRTAWRWPAFLAPLALFALVPAEGDLITIVTGFERLALALISIMIVAAFYKAPPVLPRIVAAQLERLGVISYSVYLLHPFAISWLQMTDLPPVAFVACVFAITIAAANMIYFAVERPFVALGKTVTTPSRRLGAA